MAINDSYATAALYKTIIGKTTAADDTELLIQLTGMSRLLEREITGGRYFNKDASVTIRRYYPTVPYLRSLAVEDIATTTGLIVKVDDNHDGTAETVLTITTDFEVHPLNAGTGPEPDPYTALYLPPGRGRLYWGDALVEVTATHGWPNVPDAIVQATCQLVALLRIETPRATQQINEGLAAVVGMSPAAQTIVEQLTDAYAKPAWIYS